MRKKVCIVLLSGGYDSVAVLSMMLRQHFVLALFIDCGQPYAAQERRAVRAVAEHYRRHPKFIGLQEETVRLRQSDTPVPEYVPFRNLVLTAIAANMAQALGAEVIATGSKTVDIRPDDAYSFRDSSRRFTQLLEDLLLYATEPSLPQL